MLLANYKPLPAQLLEVPTKDSLSGFNPTQTYTITGITFVGTQRTRASALSLQMSVRVGDTVRGSAIPQLCTLNEQLLYNVHLFNKVTVVPDTQSTGNLNLTVTVKERWYIWPTGDLYIGDITYYDWFKNPALHRITWGLGTDWYNVSGRVDVFNFQYTGGLNQGISITYSIPYLFKKQKLDASIWFSLIQNDEVAYGSREGQILRYHSPGADVRTHAELEIALEKRFTNQHKLGFLTGWFYVRTSDTLRILNPHYHTRPRQSLDQVPVMSVYYVEDRRDVKVFPLRGYLLSGSLIQQGLPGIGTTSFTAVELQGAYHRPLGGRWYSSAGVYIESMGGGRVPYFSKYFLGQPYSSAIRGYESYQIDYLRSVVIKSELRFAALKRRIVRLTWLPEKFEDFPIGVYPYLLADCGIVGDGSYNDFDRRYKNRPLYAAGIGLYFLTIYDVLLRLEYTINHEYKPNFQLNFKLSIY